MMNILSLKVKNFRPFKGADKEVKIVFRKGINVIVGENNVGKSSLLRALQIISGQTSSINSDFFKGKSNNEQVLEVELELGKNELKELISNITGNNKYLRKAENLERFIKDFGNKFFLTYSSIAGFSLKTDVLSFRGPRAVLIRDFEPTAQLEYKFKAFLQDYFSEKHHRIVTLMKKGAGPGLSTTRLDWEGDPTKFIQKKFQICLKVFSEIRKRPAGSSQRVLESLDGGQVASVLFSLKNGNKKEQKRFEIIKQEFSKLFPNLSLETRWETNNIPRIFIDKSPINYEMPIENIGAGIGEMIILLTHLIQSKDQIFCLDLPEMHFHPHSQRSLLKVLEEYTKNNQILIVTHSPLLINPKKVENIAIIRHHNGISFPSQLSDNYFTKKERVKLERCLLNDSKDFFFSRATLIIEGPTETGALPVFAKTLNADFDWLGISLVKMEGNHFGFWCKLLKGFGIPYAVMCDRDALMSIDGRIDCRNGKIKTSPVFCSLSISNILNQEDIQTILEIQDQIVKIDNRENYPDKFFKKLKLMVEKYNVYVLSADFEGILKKEGYSKLLEKAKSVSRSKAIQGKIVAEEIINKDKRIPNEFGIIINAVKDLLNPSSIQ